MGFIVFTDIMLTKENMQIDTSVQNQLNIRQYIFHLEIMPSAGLWVCGQLWILNLEENVNQQTADQQALIAMIVTNSVFSAGTTVLNFSIFMVLNLTTLQRSTRIILLNLTASDCLTGVLLQPLYIYLSLSYSRKVRLFAC